MEKTVFIVLIILSALEEIFLLLLGLLAAILGGFWNSSAVGPTGPMIELFFCFLLPPVLWGFGQGKLTEAHPGAARVLRFSGGILGLFFLILGLVTLYSIWGGPTLPGENLSPPSSQVI